MPDMTSLEALDMRNLSASCAEALDRLGRVTLMQADAIANLAERDVGDAAQVLRDLFSIGQTLDMASIQIEGSAEDVETRQKEDAR